ncbi:MAG: anti-oxidant AhpCTSA family protein [Rhodothermaceae bacterium]|nr:MAG: anti-oxidant AhpCTSA family protein [Rhodothermaceae bacterium]
MRIEKGQQAPDFTLYDDQREPFTLREVLEKKNVVLLFFPGAFTSVCTTELNMVNNDLEAYGPDTEVVGISTDSPFVLAEFKKVHGFRFRLLSDHDAEVCAAYGAKYNRDFTLMRLDRIARRAAFVIDRSGVVQYAEVLENAGELPDLDAVKACVSSL